MPATLVARPRRLALTPVLVVSGIDIHDEPFTERTHAHDVSGGGLSFETPRNLTVGTPLTLRVHLPRALRHRFGGRAVYGVCGRVARVERLAARRYRVGVRLLAEIDGPR
jgi:hypothetical protein